MIALVFSYEVREAAEFERVYGPSGEWAEFFRQGRGFIGTELLRDVKAAEAEEPGLLRKDRDAIDAVLSPLQQAKFRVLEVEVEHKIRELMNQIRTQRRNQQKPRPGGAQSPEP